MSCSKIEDHKVIQNTDNELEINQNEKKGVTFIHTYDVSEFGQVVEDDFYYIRNPKYRKYIIYKNEKKYIDFEYPNECVIESMVYYENAFYFIIKDLMKEKYFLYTISMKDLKLVKCFCIQGIDWEDLWYYANLYDDKLWCYVDNNICSFDLKTGELSDKYPMSKNMKKFESQYEAEFQPHKTLTFEGDKIYFGIYRKNALNVYTYDLKTHKEKKLITEKADDVKYRNLAIKIKVSGSNILFIHSYKIHIINTKQNTIEIKDMYNLSDNCFSYDNKFLYYVNKDYKLCRVSLSNGKIEELLSNCISVYCSEEKLYVCGGEKAVKSLKDESKSEGNEDDYGQKDRGFSVFSTDLSGKGIKMLYD